MDTALLTRKFEELGARVKVADPRKRWGELPRALALDIGRDERGEFFDLRVDFAQVERLDAVDVRPRDRHLLLLAHTRTYSGPVIFDRRTAWRSTVATLPPLSKNVQKPRFLCGHDERHWFVAAIPEAAHASNVATAMEALKPAGVIDAQARAGLRMKDRFTRKNRAFVRQGEWFFLPRADLAVPPKSVLRNEPMQRSGGKAHWAEFAFRRGGETVYVSTAFPRGLTEKEFRVFQARNKRSGDSFSVMRRNAQLFVRGRISHPDHATISLNVWHEVMMNTENLEQARRDVVFLD